LRFGQKISSDTIYGRGALTNVQKSVMTLKVKGSFLMHVISELSDHLKTNNMMKSKKRW
jgi:hypothetical protein